jgi:hypothetical protein
MSDDDVTYGGIDAFCLFVSGVGIGAFLVLFFQGVFA